MIATRKISWGFLIAAFFLVSGRAWAAPPCPATPQVYVSSASQILCVDAATGTITVLLTDNSSTFGDISFGPDGLLYFTDVVGSRVFRIDPKISTATPATLVATIPTATKTITGLAFSSSNGTNNGDLFVNANTGVFLIAGIACVGCSPSLPITPTQVITFSPRITAGGLAFDVLSKGEAETMTIVDTSGHVLQSAFPFTSATSLASVSGIGRGIFANFCGDTLVASGTTLDRLSFSFVNGNLHVDQSTYVDLGDTVRYFEVTADNTVLAVTFSNGAGGIVWSVAPVKDASGVPSCSAAPTTTLLVQLKPNVGKNPPDLASDDANGVALGPTSMTITENFDSTHLSRTYNFGLYTFNVTFDIIYQSFSLPFKAVRSRPADISFSGFQPGTVPKHFSPLGGFAVQVVTPSPGDPGGIFSCSDTGGTQTGQTDYGLCPTDPSAVQMIWIYATDDLAVDAGVARDNTDTLFFNPPSAQTYTDDITHDVWADCTSCGTGGKTGTLQSTYLVDNQGLVQNLTVTVQSPVASCGTTTSPTCNPQFKIGQNVDFKITFSPAPNPNITLIARLSIAKVHVANDGTIQFDQFINVFSKNNEDVDNFFNCSNSLNQCTYNWDSHGADVPGAGAGLYQATIFSNSFAPTLVYLTLK